MSSDKLAKVLPGKTAPGHLPRNYHRSIAKMASAIFLKGDNLRKARPIAADASMGPSLSLEWPLIIRRQAN